MELDRTEDLFCENPHCFVGRWAVTLSAEDKQVWRVVAYFEESAFLVAATNPTCPCCGKQLMSHFALDGGFGPPPTDEEGPLFDFVRALL